jgi:hypothetical protein
VRALLWPLFARSAWDEPATVVAGTTREGAALASVRSVGLGSTSQCVCGKTGVGASLACVRLWAWALPANVVAGTTGDVAALVSVPSVGVGTVSHWVFWHDR